MQELLEEYKIVIDRLFKADEWLGKTKYSDWEAKGIKGSKEYNTRMKLLKEAEQLQRDLHTHKINSVASV